MKKYRFNYSVDGVLTFLPLFVNVEAENDEQAKTKAEEKIKQTDMWVKKMGRKFTIYS
jgi:hypothetical protein